jgi:hypothetical protein
VYQHHSKFLVFDWKDFIESIDLRKFSLILVFMSIYMSYTIMDFQYHYNIFLVYFDVDLVFIQYVRFNIIL